MLDQVADADTGAHQGDQDRPRGRADAGVEVAHVDPGLFLQGLKGTHHPGGAKNATTAEHQSPPAWLGHLLARRMERLLAPLISTSSASESIRHCPRTSRSGMAPRSPFSPK